MRIKKILTITVLLLGSALWAAPKTKTELQTLMDSIFAHFSTLSPYLGSKDKFQEPKNSALIRYELSELSRLSSQASKQHDLQMLGFRFSRQVLEGHIKDAQRVFEMGNKEYARWMLNSSLSICMSCHTQLTSAPKVDVAEWQVMQAGNEFDRAELLFVIRNYDKAADLYSKLISGYPENKASPRDIETALRRQVAIYARIRRDPKAGMAILEAQSQNNKLPALIQKDIKAWIALFRGWTNEKPFDVKSAQDADIKKYVSSELKPELWDLMIDADNPRVVTYLKISGVLYEYLRLHPDTTISPEILFWLAQCDRGLGSNFFYSLADIYLRECIQAYPQNPIAKNCYKSYEDSVKNSYSGASHQMPLPSDVKADLNHLKSLIESGHK